MFNFNFSPFRLLQVNKVENSCCQEKENKENKDGNIILDGNNKLGLEGDEDEEEEEEDRINNEYVLYDEEHSSDGEFEEDAEGGKNSILMGRGICIVTCYSFIFYPS